MQFYIGSDKNMELLFNAIKMLLLLGEKCQIQVGQSLDLYRSGDIDVKLDNISKTIIKEISKPDDELREFRIRVPELIAYQNEEYAQEYISFVKI